jgi:hypothetical protein
VVARAPRRTKLSPKEKLALADLWNDPKYLRIGPKRMTPMQAEWENEMRGILAFLERLRVSDPGNAIPWVAGNRRHYLGRLAKLLQRTPKGMENKARFYARLAEAFGS